MTSSITLTDQNVAATAALMTQWSTNEGLSNYYNHIKALKERKDTTVSRIYYSLVAVGNLALSTLFYAYSRRFIAHRGAALAGSLGMTGLIAYRVSSSLFFLIFKRGAHTMIGAQTSAHKALNNLQQREKDAIKVMGCAYQAVACYMSCVAPFIFSKSADNLDMAKQLLGSLQRRYHNGELANNHKPPPDYSYHQKLKQPAQHIASFDLAPWNGIDVCLRNVRRLQRAARYFLYGKNISTPSESFFNITVSQDPNGQARFIIAPWPNGPVA